MTAISNLSRLICRGLPVKEERAQKADEVSVALDSLFGERYHSRSPHSKRVVFTTGDDIVHFAGLLHADCPKSGVYGGMSLIWYPIAADEDGPSCSLLTLVCGTRGLSPDEHILTRPGHLRHLRALQRLMKKSEAIDVWVKSEPAQLAESFPKSKVKDFHRFSEIIKRYGNHIYAAAVVPQVEKSAETLVRSFLDFFAWERDWAPLAKCAVEIDTFKVALRKEIFPKVSQVELLALVKQRHFVILQGPPGTGKTRMVTKLLTEDFQGKGISVQFHPSISYETFVAGISPTVDGTTLNFTMKSGWLVQALNACEQQPFLLHVDEVNRADLSRVLGEAIYLFEARELGEDSARSVQLPHPLESGEQNLTMSDNFFFVGTMNTADRSISILDMAVRRRFAFVDLWPDITVVIEQGNELAVEAFSRLQDLFSQYAPDEAFNMMPGHSYFLADNTEELHRRFKYELIPLLKEYLVEGRLANCSGELRTYVDWLENLD